MFKIIPSIDLKDGKCVNLIGGSYDNLIEYMISPIEHALDLESRGFRYVHIVDLNGSFEGIPKNIDVVKKIITNTKLKIQVSGGIRSIDTARIFYKLGVVKIVLGTIAVKNSEIAKQIIAEIGPSNIVVSIDGISGFASTDGWLKNSNVRIIEMISYYSKLGVNSYIIKERSISNIQRNNMINQIENMRNSTHSEILISGGFDSIEDLKKIEKLGIGGVMMSKFFYENKLSFFKLMKLLD